jgi:predicted DNA-binding transcriptional regulator YafY
MKSGRLLAMLLLLQARGRLSARELAGQLEVSQRTVYRDLDALSSAGVPVHAERGVSGGIVLAEGYRKALTQFDEDEIRALFTAGDDLLSDIGIEDRLPRALEKLAGALPASQRRAADTMRGRVYLDHRRWKQAAQPREHLAVLRVAVWEDRRIRLRYKDQNGRTTERIIDPLGLVAKAGVWYLVARSGEEMRTFRAERILGVEETEVCFERPQGFDLVGFWRQWIADFEERLPAYPVIMRVPRDDVEEVRSYWEAHVLDDAPRNATVLVKVIFPGEGSAIHQIIAWGDRTEIVEPQELRDKVLARAQQVLDHHALAAARS